jgi:hypothetical protein
MEVLAGETEIKKITRTRTGIQSVLLKDSDLVFWK